MKQYIHYCIKYIIQLYLYEKLQINKTGITNIYISLEVDVPKCYLRVKDYQVIFNFLFLAFPFIVRLCY